MQKTRSMTVLRGEQLEWLPAGEGQERQIMGYDGQMMMVKVKFETGAVGAIHHHYHTQTSYVVSGRFEFTVDGEKVVVGPGDGLYLEPDVVHGLTCLEAGIVIDCFTPMRADFLTK